MKKLLCTTAVICMLISLAACGSNAVISIDHGFRPTEGFGGMTGTFIYPTGYMKGLLHAAEKEVRQSAGSDAGTMDNQH